VADFGSLPEALDYASRGQNGINFYSGRGQLQHSLTYGRLRSRAIDLARRLLALGPKRGDRVAITAEMEPDFVVAFFACQYAGLQAVPLPVPTGLGGRQGYEEQLARVVHSSQSRIILGSEPLLQHLYRATDGLDIVAISTVSELMTRDASDEDLMPLGPDEPSHVQYSSGSTRNPLGIVINQTALMANARSVGRHGLKLRPGDRAASWLPFYHDMGLIGFMLIPITCQIPIDYIYTDGFARRPLEWLRLISDNRCTLAYSPTFGYELCVRRASTAQNLSLDLSCWRGAGIGGELIRPETLNNFAETFGPHGFDAGAFVPSYGLAEATLAFSFGELGHGVDVDTIDKESLINNSKAVYAANGHAPVNGNGHAKANGHGYLNGASLEPRDVRRFAFCGTPLPGYAVEIRDRVGNVLPERHVGSVFISGPSLMAGYDRAPDATSRALDEGGWLDTGDMGYMIGGRLVITGRQKDLIIVNGRNIWPQDLEWHAEENVEDVRSRDAAAFSIEDDESGKEIPVMLVQCRLQDPDARVRLRDEVHAAVFRNAGIDCRIVLIPPRSLPFTTSGKLSRAKAKQAYMQGAFDADPAVAPVMGRDSQVPTAALKAS
jgi:fatty-acyl-CoA synthase